MLTIRSNSRNRTSRRTFSNSNSNSSTIDLNKKINVPEKTFPLISAIYNELNNQINENVNLQELKVSKRNIDQLKVIIDQIDGDTKKFSLHVILYLIKKIQKAPQNKQATIIEIILNIFDKFVLIERCLLQQQIKDLEIFSELNRQFDRCIDHFVRKSIIDTHKVKEYIDQIDRELILFLRNRDFDVDINKFTKCNKSFKQDDLSLEIAKNGFFIKIRNGFLLFCSKFGISMSPKLHTLFNILQYCGDAVCTNVVSISIVLKIFSVVYQYSNVNREYMLNKL